MITNQSTLMMQKTHVNFFIMGGIKMAIFKVKSVFAITNRSSVFIKGEIESGEIHINDVLILPWNSSLGMEGKISAIEYIDSLEGSFVCLGIACEDSEEQHFWLGMNIEEGEIVTINRSS